MAAIAIIAYNGIQERAATTAADSQLKNVSKKLAFYKAEQAVFPADIAAIGVSSDQQASYNYSSTGEDYCLSATVRDVTRHVQAPSEGECTKPFEGWTVVSGGISINENAGQIEFDANGDSGQVKSPYIANNGQSHVKVTIEAYATQPSNNGGGLTTGGVLQIRYLKSKNSGSVAQNTQGDYNKVHYGCKYTLNTWSTCTWITPTGPNVNYVTLDMFSSPPHYSTDNVIRSVKIEPF